MRYVLAFALIFGLLSPVQAQEITTIGNSTVNSFESKILSTYIFADPVNPPGLRMMKVGKALTLGGAALFTLGVIVMSSADYTTTTTNYNNLYGYNEEVDPQALIGAMMVVGGVGMVVPGIIFWSKGSKKYKAYKLQESGSVNINTHGISLRYRF